MTPKTHIEMLDDYSALIATPQSDTSDSAYVASYAGVLARFYGPRANEWMELFLSALAQKIAFS